MAKLSNDAQLDVINKLTLGIVSTNIDKNYFEEDFAWTPTVLASEIWADEVPFAATKDEADAIAGIGTGNPTAPIVEKLTMYLMDEVPLSNEQAWAVYTIPGNTDPDTRIVDWLNPQLFGPGYFFELFENDGTPIALTDGRYQVDSKNGIVRFDEGFTPADLGLLTPLRITLYYYNGRKGIIGSTGPAGPAGPAFAPITQQVSSNIVLSRQVDQYVGLATGGTSGFTVTLPASPENGDRIWIKDEDANAGTNNIIINGNGNAIDGDITTEYVIDLNEQGLIMFYANGGWRIF